MISRDNVIYTSGAVGITNTPLPSVCFVCSIFCPVDSYRSEDWLTCKEEDITHVFHIIVFKKWNHESDKFRWNITLETGRGFFFPVKRATQLFSKVANMKLDFHLNGNGSANQGRGKTNKIGLSLTTLQKRVVQAMFQFSSFSLQVQKTKNTMRTATRPENHQHSALKQLPWKD